MHPTLKYSIVVLAVGTLAAFNPLKLFTFSDVTVFLTVIGLLYGIIAAFLVSSADARSDSIRELIAAEANSLIGIVILAKNLSNKKFFNKLRTSVLTYCNAVLNYDINSRKATDIFKSLRDITKSIAAVPIRRLDNKEQSLFERLEYQVDIISSSRQRQFLILEARTSGIEWTLMWFFSLFITLLVIFTQLPGNYIVATMLTVGMVSAVLLVIVVLHHLDYLSLLEETLIKTPYSDAIWVIKNDI